LYVQLVWNLEVGCNLYKKKKQDFLKKNFVFRYLLKSLACSSNTFKSGVRTLSLFKINDKYLFNIGDDFLITLTHDSK
jgi:hypothetical protein